MNESRRFQAEKLFQEVVDLPCDQRHAFLEKHPEIDPLVRSEVEKLLVYNEKEKCASLPSCADHQA